MTASIAVASSLLAFVSPVNSQPAVAGPEPVAIVCSVGAKGVLSAAHAPDRAPELFRRLSAGATIDVGPGLRLVLTFRGGARYELGEGAQVVIGAEDLTASRGPVLRLPPLSPLPLTRIAPNEGAGSRSAAVRIRGEGIGGLCPRSGERVPIDGATLRFSPMAGAGRYRVQVYDRAGMAVFRSVGATTLVSIPTGTLLSGQTYRWTVRTLDRVGPAAQGAAEFATLDATTERLRAALKRSVEQAGDAWSLALLAEVDRSLGLLTEAREELRAALAKAVRDPVLEEALQGFARSLSERSSDDEATTLPPTPRSPR